MYIFIFFDTNFYAAVGNIIVRILHWSPLRPVWHIYQDRRSFCFTNEAHTNSIVKKNQFTFDKHVFFICYYHKKYLFTKMNKSLGNVKTAHTLDTKNWCSSFVGSKRQNPTLTQMLTVTKYYYALLTLPIFCTFVLKRFER